MGGAIRPLSGPEVGRCAESVEGPTEDGPDVVEETPTESSPERRSVGVVAGLEVSSGRSEWAGVAPGATGRRRTSSSTSVASPRHPRTRTQR